MKKLLCGLLAALLLALSSCGSTSTQTLTLTEDALTLEVPRDLVVFTRDMPEDDPILKEYDTNSQGIRRGLSGRKSYAYIFDKDMTFGLDLCRIPSKTQDYRELDGEGLETLISEYAAGLPEGTQVECLEPNGELWIHYGLPTQQGYMLQWATNRGDQLYYATLTAGDQAAAEAQAPWIETMLSGLQLP